MTKREYYCPECDGCGSIDHADPSGNPALETFSTCGTCDGRQVITLDSSDPASWDARPFTPSRRRWAGSRQPQRCDVLEGLARSRREAAKATWQHPKDGYARLRRWVMRPVDLPDAAASAWLRGTIDPILTRYVEGAR